jgi:hypothetical protein
MDPNPLPDTESYAGSFAPLLGTWESLLNSSSPGAAAVAHVSDRRLPYGLSVEMLAELESDWFSALEPGNALQHGDSRRDNVAREPSGRLWLVDWTHRWLGPGWADWVRLAPDVAASGFDPEAVLRHSAWNDADDHGVNVMLAALAGRCWRWTPPRHSGPASASTNATPSGRNVNALACRTNPVVSPERIVPVVKLLQTIVCGTASVCTWPTSQLSSV